jgi:ADP-heptose:LPS heptosyltransferase
MAAAFPILFVTSSTLSDAVLSSGLLKRLYDEIPNAVFTVAGGAETQPLFRDMPQLERFIPVGEGGVSGLALWTAVRSQRWGLVADTRGGSLARFISAKKRAVHKAPPLDAGLLHKVEDAARLLKLEDEPPAPYLFVGTETQAQADALLGPIEGPIVMVAPGADWIGRTWPAERFNEVAARLLGPDGPLEGGRLVILGADTHRDAAHTVRFATARDRVLDLTGKTEPLVAYACLKRARLFLGNDTPMMHLAAAAGAPTIGLFGPSDERRAGPWGPDARAIRGPRAYEDFVAIDPNLTQALNHMLDLPVETVLDAAMKLVAATEPSRTEAPRAEASGD